MSRNAKRAARDEDFGRVSIAINRLFAGIFIIAGLVSSLIGFTKILSPDRICSSLTYLTIACTTTVVTGYLALCFSNFITKVAIEHRRRKR